MLLQSRAYSLDLSVKKHFLKENKCAILLIKILDLVLKVSFTCRL